MYGWMYVAIMFICGKCLLEKYENDRGLSLSVGECEDCGHEGVCSDIPSRLLREKKAKAPLVDVEIEGAPV